MTTSTAPIQSRTDTINRIAGQADALGALLSVIGENTGNEKNQALGQEYDYINAINSATYRYREWSKGGFRLLGQSDMVFRILHKGRFSYLGNVDAHIGKHLFYDRLLSANSGRSPGAKNERPKGIRLALNVATFASNQD
jgi:hypothetical protein